MNSTHRAHLPEQLSLLPVGFIIFFLGENIVSKGAGELRRLGVRGKLFTIACPRRMAAVLDTNPSKARKSKGRNGNKEKGSAPGTPQQGRSKGRASTAKRPAAQTPARTPKKRPAASPTAASPTSPQAAGVR